MGQELAKQIIALDVEHAKVLLRERYQEVDDSFITWMKKASDEFKASRDFGAAMDTLRKLYSAGNSRNDNCIYLQSFTLLLVAHLEKEQDNTETAIGNARASLNQANKQPANPRCRKVIDYAQALLDELESKSSPPAKPPGNVPNQGGGSQKKSGHLKQKSTDLKHRSKA